MPLRLGSFRWSVGSLSVVIGAMMLVVPHQFDSPVYAALRDALPVWGMAFFVIGLGLISLAVLAHPRWLAVLLHLGAGGCFLTLAEGVALSGGWTGTANFGMIGIVAALAPFLSDSVRRRGDRAGPDALSLSVGSGAVLTGLSILLFPGQFVNPIYDVIRPGLFLFAGAFLAAGAALVAVQFRPVLSPALGTAAYVATGLVLLAFCTFSSVPLRAWIGIAYYGGVGTVILLFPWIEPRARQFDLTSLRARLALAMATVLVVSDVAVIALLDDVIIARVGSAWAGSINEVRELSFAVLVVSVAVAAAAGAVVANWLARPLRALTSASERLAAEDLSAPLPESDVREVADLTSTFGFMRERLALRERSLRETMARMGQSRAQLEAVFQAVQDGVVVSDMEGNFLLVNDAEAEINGFSSAEEMKRNLAYFTEVYEIRRPDGSTLPKDDWPISRVLKGESLDDLELRGRRRDTGQEWFFSFSGEPVRDENGRQSLAVVITRDLTARKRAEADRERLLESEQAARKDAEASVRARDEFFSVAAHEIKTPITSLQGFAQMLARQFESRGSIDPARQAKAMETIVRQTRKLTALTDQLLSLSRLQAGRLSLVREVMDLSASVEAAVSAMRASHPGRRIEFTGVHHIQVLVDPMRFEQVLVNLVDNALKFSQKDSTITVEVGRRGGDWAEVVVQDEGIGIPEEKRERLFERFYQAHPERHYGGMGIGLFMGRHIVEMHGGTLDYDPVNGGGSRFTIRIPVHQDALEDREQSNSAPV